MCLGVEGGGGRRSLFELLHVGTVRKAAIDESFKTRDGVVAGQARGKEHRSHPPPDGQGRTAADRSLLQTIAGLRCAPWRELKFIN